MINLSFVPTVIHCLRQQQLKHLPVFHKFFHMGALLLGEYWVSWGDGKPFKLVYPGNTRQVLTNNYNSWDLFCNSVAGIGSMNCYFQDYRRTEEKGVDQDQLKWQSSLFSWIFSHFPWWSFPLVAVSLYFSVQLAEVDSDHFCLVFFTAFIEWWTFGIPYSTIFADTPVQRL